MKIVVLGGCGIQGRCVVHDAAGEGGFSEVICADADLSGLERIAGFTDMRRVRPVQLDATESDSLRRVMEGADVVVDLLPRWSAEPVCRAAFGVGVPVVNTNYAYPVAHLDEAAKAAGVAIMPECGLDPGIDLVLYGEAARRFDELHLLNSYCGGFPEAAACDNPLNYKISWIWEGVLSAANRAGRMIRDGNLVEIPAIQQHQPAFIHSVEDPELGTLEAIPNGDAVFFTDALGVTPSIRETGRYSLRWPGWSAFWHPLKQLGFLDDAPVEGLPCAVSPVRMLDKLLGPRLQYRRDEKDLVIMLNVFEGLMGGKRVRLVSRMRIERDLETGIMAMAKGVGYPAAIVAGMLARGEIPEKGVLSPMKHIPCGAFLSELRRRGIVIEETETVL